MAKLQWDKTGSRYFENGVSNGVLYPTKADGTYDKGVAWNGLTSVSESPEGADANDLWADNMKYASLRSAEVLKLSIEAYTYPDEFAACDGSAEPVEGVKLGQQLRKSFALCYRTNVGNDQDSELGYKLHIVYGCFAAPSERGYETINDSPDAITFSWDVDTTPMEMTGYKPVSSITIDSLKVDATKLQALEDKLYGTANAEPELPLPSEILTMMAA